MNKFLKQLNIELAIPLCFLYVSILIFGGSYSYMKANPYQYEAPVREVVEEVEDTPEEASTEQVEETEPIQTYNIVIDPGHGGNDSGVMFFSDEGEINEKTVNYKIAVFMKEALEQYEGVNVVLTRTEDKYMELQERTDFAVAHEADLLISLHNNSMEDAGGYACGCSVCVAMGNYKEEIGMASQLLGCNIAYELSQIGIKNNGLVMRSSKDTDYENGRAADYYANIRNPLMNDIPAVIVEHGFLDNPDDYYDFLCSDAQLKKVGEADARGVARYLQLRRTDTKEILSPLEDYKIKICHMRRSKSTKRYSTVYYRTK